MSVKSLDESELIEYMGWNYQSVANILRDFIRDQDLDIELLAYLKERAVAEGETTDEEDDDGDD